MKIFHFIIDLYRLLFVSIYKRFKNLDMNSRIVVLSAYILIINLIVNFYFIDSLISQFINIKDNVLNWGIIRLTILVLSSLIIVILDYKFKKDKHFILKYKKIITHSMFEFVIFFVLFFLILIVNLSDKNSVF